MTDKEVKEESKEEEEVKHMGLNEYQWYASKTVNQYMQDNPEMLFMYCMTGMGAEAGEYLGHMSRAYRGDFADAINGTVDDKDNVINQLLLRELGDVLWMVAMNAACLGSSLEDVARYNLNKLDKRMKEGKIEGYGDTREQEDNK